MKINLLIYRRNFTLIGFFCLFPGFFFYHYAIAIELFPPFLGGYFTYVSLFFFTILLLLNLHGFIKKKCLVEVVFFLLLLLSFCVSIANYFIGNPINYTSEMLLWSLSGVIFNLTCYFLAKDIALLENYKRHLMILFVVMFVIVVFNIGDRGIFYIKEVAGDAADSVSTYQGFARSLIFVLLCLVALYFENKTMMILIFFLGAITLFFNGARSEFVMFIISVFMLFIGREASNIRTIVLSFIPIILFFVFAVYLIDIVPDSRMFQLVSLSESSSFEARYIYFQNGINIVVNNPILGSYGEYSNLGGIGKHPHNIISSWVNLGIVGFVGYILVLTLLWGEVFKSFITKKIFSNEFNLFFLFLVFLTLGYLFAKDHTYMIFGFSVGLYVNFKRTVNPMFKINMRHH